MSQEEASDGLSAIWDSNRGMLLVATGDAVNNAIGTIVNVKAPSTMSGVAMGLSTYSMFSNVIVESDENLSYYVKY